MPFFNFDETPVLTDRFFDKDTISLRQAIIANCELRKNDKEHSEYILLTIGTQFKNEKGEQLIASHIASLRDDKPAKWIKPLFEKNNITSENDFIKLKGKIINVRYEMSKDQFNNPKMTKDRKEIYITFVIDYDAPTVTEMPNNLKGNLTNLKNQPTQETLANIKDSPQATIEEKEICNLCKNQVKKSVMKKHIVGDCKIFD